MDVFAFRNLKGRCPPKKTFYPRYHPHLEARHVAKSRKATLTIHKVIKAHLLVRPEAIACRSGLISFTADVFFPSLYLRDAWPTGVKFCTMVSTRPYFIMPVQNFGGGAPQKNFRGEKHAKFSLISDNFEVRRQISPKRMKIFKIGFLFRPPQFLLR